jgi:tRNA(fMet)-specific endonuclease VapC
MEYDNRGSARNMRVACGIPAGLPHTPVDDPTSGTYAEIRDELKRAGRPIPTNDLWIAALARQHELPLISRDRDFDSVRGLKHVGW